jgi:transcriptional regulator with XRE-family HTH domain
MSSSERSQLLERLQSKEFRDALVEADIANGILFQLQAMLEERGWTQDELAERAGTAQPVVSKYMRGYENFSLKTLKKLASAFDVSLTVRFERFSDLVHRYLNLDSADLKIPSFNEDSALYAPVFEYPLASTTAITGAFPTGSFIAPTTSKFTLGQLDLDFGCVAPGSRETWPFGTTTRPEKGEETYAPVLAA